MSSEAIMTFASITPTEEGSKVTANVVISLFAKLKSVPVKSTEKAVLLTEIDAIFKVEVPRFSIVKVLVSVPPLM